MLKWRILSFAAVLIAMVAVSSAAFQMPKTRTPAERAQFKAAQSKPMEELLRACRDGGAMECHALHAKRLPFGEVGYAIPLLLLFMVVSWFVFIRGKAPAPYLLPYATVWARAVSVFAEACLAMLVFGAVRIALGDARHWAILPNLVLFEAYTVAAHAFFGQNFGKFVAGIRIVRANGDPIGWKEALVRSAVQASIGLAIVAIQLATLSQLNLDGIDEPAKTAVLMASQPAAWSWLQSVSFAWMLSEIAVALLNRHRRAMHDYLAGTVVIARSL